MKGFYHTTWLYPRQKLVRGKATLLRYPEWKDGRSASRLQHSIARYGKGGLLVSKRSIRRQVGKMKGLTRKARA